ncbi:hypothetical protein TrCOL_g2860 [Triparma columacea]|uniref:Hsp70-Hsp90 organising protein n=1 Tax=Triparma columacea TaxID=722753 RepID=A0A9W7LAJ9_9STRA|nr:hypothetical protein TrCOL_g2860 [Triparma columacea]
MSAEAEEGTGDEAWRTQAAALKKEGDEAFKLGNYKDAVKAYTDAIDIDDENHILYSNRCACLLKLSEKSKALRDGEKCVSLAPSWAKGYGRLGSAQHSLTRYAAAADTYRKGLKLDPENTALKAGLEASMSAKAAKAKWEAENKAAEDAARAAEEKAAVEKETPAEKPEEKTEDDLLGDFFGDIAATVEAKQSTAPKKEIKPQDKYKEQKLGTSSENIDRLLQVNYAWKNLNPFKVMMLDIDANIEDVKLRYRKLSTLVHPDKNIGEERAKDAFDEVKKAYNILKDTEGQFEYTKSLVVAGRTRGEEVHKANGGDREDCKVKEVMKVFAEIEAGRRQAEKNKLAAKKRERAQEDDQQAKLKQDYTFNKSWEGEERKEKRVGNWRDFNKSKKTKN